MFTLASHRTMGKLSADANQAKLLDVVIEELKYSQEVLQYLAPVPAGKAPTTEPPPKKHKPGNSGGNNPNPNQQKSAPGGGKSPKGSSGSKLQLPPNCVTHDDENKPLCFGYQFGKCKWRGEAGKRCARGFHKCFLKGCFRLRPYHLCTHTD